MAKDGDQHYWKDDNQTLIYCAQGRLKRFSCIVQSQPACDIQESKLHVMMNVQDGILWKDMWAKCDDAPYAEITNVYLSSCIRGPAQVGVGKCIILEVVDWTETDLKAEVTTSVRM